MKKQNSKIIGLTLCVILIATSFATAHPITPLKKTPYSLRDIPVNTIGQLTDSDTRSNFEFRFSTPLFTKEEQKTLEGTVFLFYSFENCQYVSEPGKPKLPFSTSYIHIPNNAQDVQINILSSSQREERLEYPIYPAEKQIIIKDKTNDFSFSYSEFYYDKEFYANSENFYPSSPVEIAEMGNIRGYRYIVVNMYPLQYQPKDNILRITEEMSLQITWNGEETSSSQHLPTSFQNIINGLQMLNTKDGEQVDEGVRDGQVQYPTDLADESNQADYLIITADAFYPSSSLADIAQHRATYSGLNVAIVQTFDIYPTINNTIPGGDSELSDPGDGKEGDKDLWIKTFLKYVYNYWDNGTHRLQYVLLVGDAFPPNAAFYLPFHTSTVLSDQSQISTDYWYSCLNDDNGDQVIDDSDDVADVIIGRFSVKTESDLATVVNKTISYELYPPVYPEQEWGSKVLLTFSKGDPALSNPLQEIRDTYVLSHQREVSEIYSEDYSEGQSMNAAMKSKINEGHALFVHAGHGGAGSWQIDNDPDFTTYDVADLTNAERLPVIFSMSCWTGMFDYSVRQCLAEVFVNSPGKGSVAFLGASRPSNSYYNNNFLKNIMNAMVVNENLVLGSSIVEAKLGINIIYNNRLLYNLLGDPALDMSHTLVKSEKPELTCSINHVLPDVDTIVFNVSVNNIGLSAAEDALVELFINHPSQGGTLIAEATHTICVAAKTNGTYEIAAPLNDLWNDIDFYLAVDEADGIDELCENNNFSPPFPFTFIYADPHGPYSGLVNWSIPFNGSAIGWFPPFNYTWIFEDEVILYGQNSVRIFSDDVFYSVVLQVRDSRNHMVAAETFVDIRFELVADARGPYVGFVHEQVNFLGLAREGFPFYNITWDFGDGTTGEGLRERHIYNATGVYQLNFTVIDTQGFIATDSTTVTIGERSPIVWVDDDFNDSTTGFGIDHFAYIADGIRNILEHGTVYVLNGTYVENLYIDRPMSVCGYYKESTIIDGSTEMTAIICDSDDISISGLTVTNSSRDGIEVYTSSNGSISDNIIVGNMCGVNVLESSNYTISDNILRNNNWGFQISLSEQIKVHHNSISNNYYKGIGLTSSLNCTIVGNDIRENIVGVHVVDVPGVDINTIVFYHNNFVDNEQQVFDECQATWYVCRNVWDDGYLSGGNYWSDYNDTDQFHGPDQQDMGSDGIGDTAYDIDVDTIDRYPFFQENGWDVPRNPHPYHYQGQVDVSSNLSWTWSGFEPVTFDVYFGTTNPPSEKVSANQTATTYTPRNMRGITKYFWKVVAWDNTGRCVESPVWCFKTAYDYHQYEVLLPISG